MKAFSRVDGGWSGWRKAIHKEWYKRDGGKGDESARGKGDGEAVASE